MNTLDYKATPVHGSKEHFYEQSLGRALPITSTVPVPKELKRKDLSLKRQSELPNKKLRTCEASPDILQEKEPKQGSALMKIALDSVNHSVHFLTSNPTSQPDKVRNNYVREPQSSQDEGTITERPKKLPVPWDLPNSTGDSITKITSRPEMVMSDEDEKEERFTKGAAQQRMRLDDYDDDDDFMEVRYRKQVNGIVRKTVSTSTVYSQQQFSSPSRRIRRLEEIIPDNILQSRPTDRSSPDIIQGHTNVTESNLRNTRRSRTTLANGRSANLVQTKSKKTSEDYSNPTDLKMFRTRRMLFGRALRDVSGYVLVVDKATRTFSIDYDTNMLGGHSILSDIPVDRIHRVTHGDKGQKVRIETSEIRVIGHEILLELNSHKLACDLATLLSTLGNGVNVQVKPDSWIDKVFDKFCTIVKDEREVAQAAEQVSVISPHFEDTDTGKTNSRRNGLNVNHAVIDPSLGGPDDVKRAPEPRERRSAAGRRQHMLQEDRDERDVQEDPNRAPRDPGWPASRSRTTRSAVRSSKSPPIKYSQTGKLGQPWNSPLSYPSNGKKRATVYFDDLSRLDEDEFLNDNIIAFFLRYLEHYLEREQCDISKRTYFFNSYFYEKLRQSPKDKKNVINYDGVKKWTDKIGLFNRDFIVVPVNENLHWYVAIICNLSWFRLSEEERDALDAAELVDSSLMAERDSATENANDTQQSLQELSLEDRDGQGDILVSDLAPEGSNKSNGSPKKKGRKRKSEPHLRSVSAHLPAIITLDSLNLPRYGTVSALKHYIAQEAKVRLEKDIDISVIQGLSAKKIPMQSNYSDCGLFVCAYLERFAMNPTSFMKQELGRIPQQWPELHSHDLRSRMRDLILELQKVKEGKASNEDLPSVGGILLPSVTIPQSAPNRAPVVVENGDETMYRLPNSSEDSHARLLHEEKPLGVKDQPLDAEKELMDIRNGPTPGDAHYDINPTSLKARTAKILSSPITRPGGSFTVPESDSEKEATPVSSAKDDPRALAKRLRDARSPKHSRNIRSDSVSTDYLNGHESYEHAEQQMPDDDLNDNEQMLV